MTRIKVIALLGVIVLFAAGAMIWAGGRVIDRAGGMAPEGTSAAEFEAAKVGTLVKLIVVVERTNGQGEIGAQILNQDGQDRYIHSGRHITMSIPADTDFLMGNRRDVKPDAVLQINGRLSGPEHLTLRNVVILTGFVRVAA